LPGQTLPLWVDPSSLVWFWQAHRQGPGGNLDARIQAELIEDAGDVGFDGSGPTTMSSAISRLVFPWATQATTSRSRRDNPPNRALAAWLEDSASASDKVSGGLRAWSTAAWTGKAIAPAAQVSEKSSDPSAPAAPCASFRRRLVGWIDHGVDRLAQRLGSAQMREPPGEIQGGGVERAAPGPAARPLRPVFPGTRPNHPARQFPAGLPGFRAAFHSSAEIALQQRHPTQ
jgi:hypothetical protein